MSNTEKISILLISLLFFILFKNWFSNYPLSSGDWAFQYSEQIKNQYLLPIIWDYNLNSGLGENNSYILGLSWYFHITSFILSSAFQFSWVLIERIVWFWPFLIVSFFSSLYLSSIVIKEKIYRLVSTIIYISNSYILMVVGGGQMGVAMAYSVAPFLFGLSYQLANISKNSQERLRKILALVIVAGIQALFDIRIYFITLLGIGIYYIVYLIAQKNRSSEFLRMLIIESFLFPISISLLLNAFWLLPTILYRINPFEQYGQQYSSIAAVKFFSFAQLENTLSLLHPNWPENIFGKVSFMKPEFLLIPVLAYGCLLVMKKNGSDKSMAHQNILFFSLIGIIGAFLAKGVNEPFGQIYTWLFSHVPGFIMFRDSTKFYLYIALAYSILIPYTLLQFGRVLRERKNIVRKISPTVIVLLFFIGYWFLLIYPALFGSLSGTFSPHSVPVEYIDLKNLLSSDKNFYRTLWIPTVQRYAYSSTIHPAISSSDLFKVSSPKEITQKLKSSSTQSLLKELGVRYVIVPFDSHGEIFLDDRKYSNDQYQKTISNLDSILYLNNKRNFGKIAVFELNDFKDHFFSLSESEFTWCMISPTDYQIKAKNDTISGKLVFSESFNQYWKAKIDSKIVKSEKYKLFNSFQINSAKDAEIYYEPQRSVYLGVIISFFTSIAILVLLARIKLYEKSGTI